MKILLKNVALVMHEMIQKRKFLIEESNTPETLVTWINFLASRLWIAAISIKTVLYFYSVII